MKKRRLVRWAFAIAAALQTARRQAGASRGRSGGFRTGTPCGSARSEFGYGQPYNCGVDATRFLADLVTGRVVSCEEEGRDRYGRLIDRCWVRGESGAIDVGDALVRSGWAVAYRQYSRIYLAAEDEARRMRRGIWGGPSSCPGSTGIASKEGSSRQCCRSWRNV
jgi:endonuclease YncB( thermonuclease family)